MQKRTQNIFKYDTVTFTIKENALDYAEISGFMETPLQLNASEQDCLNAIYNDGFDIALYYLNGEKTIVNVFDNSEVTISGTMQVGFFWANRSTSILGTMTKV